ncbi:MAG: apolipoprotein N-acyltransferase [Planctomycetota bacterium]|nr:apolipoprotein N-acyltransferase [Planctomycetota bacterium]MDI6787682.1 apolipoprotein N-acyltransferase [Planctomycetota bacterium]
MSPVLPFVSAVLIYLSYPPVDATFLAWVSYVPLFLYVAQKSKDLPDLTAGQAGKGLFSTRFPFVRSDGVRFLLSCYLAGVLFFVLGLWWLSHVTWAGLVVIPVILAAYWVIFGMVGYLIGRMISLFYLTLALPCVWVFLEYLRSFLLTGFPWFFAGHTQYLNLSLIQISDITGCWGISFIVLFINAVFAYLCQQWIEHKKIISSNSIVLLLITLIVLGGSIWYGKWRLDNLRVRRGPNIGIVQGNIEQTLKLNPQQAENIYRKHLLLTLELLESPVSPDLIIWAETMYPFAVGLFEENIDGLKESAILCKTPMLIGTLTVEDSYPPDAALKRAIPRLVFPKSFGTERERRIFNSAYYLAADGEILGRYDKIHLVPMSEYVPLKNIIPFMDKIIVALSELQQVSDMSPGENLDPFSLPTRPNAEGGQVTTGEGVMDYRYGVLICYESIFPELTSESVRKGADFIVNISNDGWFKDSAELEQMLIISAFRAVENRITFVRATNTGISAIIHHSGEIDILKGEDGKLKEVEGAWVKPLELSEKAGSFYTKYGDFFPYLCLLKLIIIIILKYLNFLDRHLT